MRPSHRELVGHARKRLLALLALWTTFGLWSASQYHLMNVANGRAMESFVRPFRVYLASAWQWALFSLLIVALARRFRVQRPRRAQALVVHLAAAVAIAATDVALDLTLYPWLVGHAPERPFRFATSFLAQFNINVFSYFVVVAVTHALDYYRWFRERQLRAAQLQEQLVRAQLEALKMQLQPHFLFNTLHLVSELVHHDPDAADEVVTRLGDLLRMTVESASAQEVSLKQEMEFLAGYIDIQQMRFKDLLTIDQRIDPDALDALVPNLVLQPLVENAIRHGVAPRAGPGLVRIVAARVGDRLQVTIEDDGVGLPGPGRTVREGVGLRTTRARLEQLYGASHHFSLDSRAPRGAIVTLSIPFRTSAGATADYEADNPYPEEGVA